MSTKPNKKASKEASEALRAQLPKDWKGWVEVKEDASEYAEAWGLLNA